MNTTLFAGDVETLERMMDEYGTTAVLECMAEIAEAKEDHVLTNWQDKNLAGFWRSVARRIYSCTNAWAKRYPASITGPF